MSVETWKLIWTTVFVFSVILFYCVVLAVGVKGSGDVRQMIAGMLAERRRRDTPK